jgi:hypothetical protein
LAALYRPKELNASEGRRHKTSIDLARQLMAVLNRRFPHRKFVLLGGGGYASHELALLLAAPQAADAGQPLPPAGRPVHAAAPAARGQARPAPAQGRPGPRATRPKGEKLPAPRGVAAASALRRSTVGWYGGKTRRVGFASGTGHRYKGGEGLVPVRWVFVHDLEGTHEGGYFYSTDPSLSPSRVVTPYTGRWSIEVAFQEARQHLGFHTPRNWRERSVLRTAPCLLGLFSLVCPIH